MRINNAHDAVLYKDFLTCLRLGQMGLCVSSTPDSLDFRWYEDLTCQHWGRFTDQEVSP